MTAGAGCAWTAASNDSWITITSGAAGTGNGPVGFSVTANTGAARTGTATIATQTFTVNQAAGAASCAYAISPTEANIGPEAGQGTVSVITDAACAWTATSNTSWITVTSGATGTGRGTVALSLTANTGAARTGTVTVATQTFTVTQRAATIECSYSISPTSQTISASGGTGVVNVTAPFECTWMAGSTVSWIIITAEAIARGNSAVGFTVSPNTGPSRTGTLVIAGQTFTLTQGAATSSTQ